MPKTDARPGVAVPEERKCWKRLKLPASAFDFYWRLGPKRTIAAVAEEYDCSREAVENRAEWDQWRERLTAIERGVVDGIQRAAIREVLDMNERHLEAVRTIQRQALLQLQKKPIDNTPDALRALDMALKHERLVLGQPTEHTQIGIGDVIKRELADWVEYEEVPKNGDAPKVIEAPTEET